MDDLAISMYSAVIFGDLERVEYLIKQGVSVDSRGDDNYYDRTPLHWAAERGEYEVAQLLISNHCNVNPKDCYGCTPVMLAAKFERKDVVHLLLKSGAQVDSADEVEWTVLLRASFHGWVDVVQRIVESGEADLNAATSDRRTPLMHAAINGHEDVTALLLRAGADVQRRDEKERTALHRASKEGHAKVVQVLLEEEGLDLNPQDLNGKTPLHLACSWGRSEVVKQLLIAGADTNIKNNDSKTALCAGIRRNKLTLAEIRLFMQHRFFFEDRDNALIYMNPFLKNLVLKDVDICTRSIVNRFHHQSLPALFSNPNFAKKLPSVENFELSAQQMRDVEHFVKCDIQTNTFCNIVEARPSVLGVLCVHSLLAYQSNMKRSASPDFCAFCDCYPL